MRYLSHQSHFYHSVLRCTCTHKPTMNISQVTFQCNFRTFFWAIKAMCASILKILLNTHLFMSIQDVVGKCLLYQFCFLHTSLTRFFLAVPLSTHSWGAAVNQSQNPLHLCMPSDGEKQSGHACICLQPYLFAISI